MIKLCILSVNNKITMLGTVLTYCRHETILYKIRICLKNFEHSTYLI